MQEIEFTKEDEYCIRNFGYNTVGDYENLKQLEDKEHLIVEELEYRLQQKDNIIKEVREYIEKNTEEKKSWLNGIPDYRVFEGDTKELLEILEKENNNANNK